MAAGQNPIAAQRYLILQRTESYTAGQHTVRVTSARLLGG